MIALIATKTEDNKDITSQYTIFGPTALSASGNIVAQALIKLGDGATNILDGTGGNFEVQIEVSDASYTYVVQPNPQVITFDTSTRAGFWTKPFSVKEDDTVTIKLLSPNAADTGVDYTVEIYDLNAQTVDVGSIDGSAQSLTDLKHFADSGYNPATSKVQGVVLVDTTTTNTDMAAAFTEIKGATWSSTTDTLEAIRDRGDAAWTTGTLGSAVNLQIEGGAITIT